MIYLFLLWDSNFSRIVPHMNASLRERIRMMESLSKPQLLHLIKRIVGVTGVKSKTRSSKNNLARALQSHGVTSLERLNHIKASNNMMNRAVLRKIQEKNKMIQNLRKKTKNYRPIRAPRGRNNTELILNSIRARDELISHLRRKI